MFCGVAHGTALWLLFSECALLVEKVLGPTGVCEWEVNVECAIPRGAQFWQLFAVFCPSGYDSGLEDDFEEMFSEEVRSVPQLPLLPLPTVLHWVRLSALR